MTSPLSSPGKIAVLALSSVVFLAIALRVIGYGFLPPDDALRHSAFAVSGKTWGEVLLINPAFPSTIDPHVGWHQFLRVVHKALGLDAQGLVVFSTCFTFVTFCWVGLVASRAPVAWLAACLVVFLADGIYFRLLLGRPFAIDCAVLVGLLFMFTREEPRSSLSRMVWGSLGLIAATWVHSTVWYLWFILVFSLLLCRKWRYAAEMVGMILVGLVGASLLSGSWYNVFVASLTLLKVSVTVDPIVGTSLVSEMQPSAAPIMCLLIAGGVLLWRVLRGGSLRKEVASVDFIVFAVTWVLGMRYLRFYVDWGIPAFAVWICRQISGFSWDRLKNDWEWVLLTGFLASATFLCATADVGGRYTTNLKSSLLTKPVEEWAKYLPDKGGTLYSVDMGVFYKIFLRMPHADFRFSTGFEAGLMPPEDLAVMRAVQFNQGELKAYAPWFSKMQAKDRIILYYPIKPEWEGMEFSQFYTAWVGKKVEKGASVSAGSPKETKKGPEDTSAGLPPPAGVPPGNPHAAPNGNAETNHTGL